jgi:hypothetical protein
MFCGSAEMVDYPDARVFIRVDGNNLKHLSGAETIGGENEPGRQKLQLIACQGSYLEYLDVPRLDV